MTYRSHNISARTHSRPAPWARLCGVFMSVSAMLCCPSCLQDEHSGYASVPSGTWLYGDTLTLLHPQADSTLIVPVEIAVALRHANNYEYSNIWLSLTYTGPDSLMTDTIDITLADDFGNWLGQGMGVSYQKIDTVLTGVSIDLSRPVKINHIMRTDTLRGIEQVGVVIIDKTTKQ